MISLDTETTGVDLHHGAKPYLVTICNESGDQTCWTWPVDPLTREPQIPEEDLFEIQQEVDDGQEVILQNGKFDVAALRTIAPNLAARWRWDLMQDTIIAGHLLASNQPHNLTDMAAHYLGLNIAPFEKRVEEATQEARRLARSKYPDWRIAKEGETDMPSAKEKTWKYDMWLPRALALELGYSEDHPWQTVAQEYANTDSATTLLLWRKMRSEIERRELWEIYRERMKVIPIAYRMEERGVSLCKTRLDQLQSEYSTESERAGRVCVNIAAGLGYELKLPNGAGLTNSLRDFCFQVLELPPVVWTDKGNPSLDKDALDIYLATLPNGSRSLAFVRALKSKRSLDTALSYLASYERFWLPIKDGGYSGENPKKILAQGQENSRVLDMDGREVSGERVRPIRSPGGVESPSSELPSIRGADTGGSPSAARMRRPIVRKSQTPIPGDRVGQHEGHDSQGQRRQSKGDEAPISEGDGQGGSGDKETIPGRHETGGSVPEIPPKSSSNLRDSPRQVLEAFAYYRLHPSLNPTGTDTLRWSSSCPNEQNISKKENFNLRFCFGPGPDREWWSLDAKNLELRIPAYESGEKMMVELFDRPKDPPYFGSYHLLIFDILHPDKFALHGAKSKDVYESTWYQWTKNGNFAVTYGAIERSGTADRAYHIPGAQRRIQDKLRDLTKLNDKYKGIANRLGYVETLPDKSVDATRGYPLLCTRLERGGILPTVPFNYHVQGTACWWTMKAMIRCQEKLDQWASEDGFDGYMNLQVHDELVFDFPKAADPFDDPENSNLWRIEIIRKLMEQGGQDIGVPTPVSCEYHRDNWSTGESL